MSVEKHTINITVASVNNVHTALFEGTEAAFSADTKEWAIGLLLEWLAEQFHTRAEGLSSGRHSRSARENVRERLLEYGRRETDVSYAFPPDRPIRRGR
ncbi:MAG TPA: hypothetical protein VJU61_22105 [Polyangiaceae bacterium]|nr:hypothetical protein [Polyangiaceae bacterium]